MYPVPSTLLLTCPPVHSSGRALSGTGLGRAGDSAQSDQHKQLTLTLTLTLTLHPHPHPSPSPFTLTLTLTQVRQPYALRAAHA